MKCQILCTTCAVDMENRQGDGSQYPNEHIKYVRGTTKINPYVSGGVSVCDYCDDPLPLKTPCAAVTIWVGDNYKPWESSFIDVPEIQT